MDMAEDVRTIDGDGIKVFSKGKLVNLVKTFHHLNYRGHASISAKDQLLNYPFERPTQSNTISF
jgi:hypothetical protein